MSNTVSISFDSQNHLRDAYYVSVPPRLWDVLHRSSTSSMGIEIEDTTPSEFFQLLAWCYSLNVPMTISIPESMRIPLQLLNGVSVGDLVTIDANRG